MSSSMNRKLTRASRLIKMARRFIITALNKEGDADNARILEDVLDNLWDSEGALSFVGK